MSKLNAVLKDSNIKKIDFAAMMGVKPPRLSILLKCSNPHLDTAQNVVESLKFFGVTEHNGHKITVEYLFK